MYFSSSTMFFLLIVLLSSGYVFGQQETTTTTTTVGANQTTKVPLDSSDETRVHDLQSGDRSIIGLGMTKSRLVVIISDKSTQSGTTNFDDFYAYDLPRTAFDGTRFGLYGGQLIKDKWPALYQKLKDHGSTTMITMFDNSNSYLVFRLDGTYGMELTGGKVEPMVGFEPNRYHAISSFAPMSFYSLVSVDDGNASSSSSERIVRGTPLVLSKWAFSGISLPLAGKLHQQGKSYHLCKSDNDSVISQRDKQCDQPVVWLVYTGFVDGERVVLVDAHGGLVIFSLTDVQSGGGKSIAVTKVARADAYRLGSDNPGDRNHSESSNEHLKRSLIIGISILAVLILFLAPIMYYLICYRKKEQQAAQKQQQMKQQQQIPVKAAISGNTMRDASKWKAVGVSKSFGFRNQSARQLRKSLKTTKKSKKGSVGRGVLAASSKKKCSVGAGTPGQLLAASSSKKRKVSSKRSKRASSKRAISAKTSKKLSKPTRRVSSRKVSSRKAVSRRSKARTSSKKR